jgi:hypothetical protein
MNCPVCKREIIGNGSKHHLIPVLKGGRNGEIVVLHKVCHDKIHSVFTERELQVKYNTVEKLLEHEEIIAFVKWVSKKPNDFYDSSKKNNNKSGWR